MFASKRAAELDVLYNMYRLMRPLINRIHFFCSSFADFSPYSSALAREGMNFGSFRPTNIEMQTASELEVATSATERSGAAKSGQTADTDGMK